MNIPLLSPGRILRALAFPALLASAVGVAIVGYAPGRAPLLLPAIVLAVMAVAIALERWLPFEPRWNHKWSGSRGDGLFFLLAQPSVALAEAAALALGTAAALALQDSASAWWPAQWPLWLQTPSALVLAELGPYLYHRASHESHGLLWRLHALHHAPERLYSLNFARFHPLNTFLSSFLMLFPLVALGAPGEVVLVVAVIQKTHSLLSHTNFDFRLGPLNWIFSMAEVHRWHHVRDVNLGNANYGATLAFWDLVFRTRRVPRSDVRSHSLGIKTPLPTGVCRQICLAEASPGRSGSST